MGLALVVFKEHARRAVQLRDDDALGTVDDERALVGHQGHFAHVDLLLLDFLDHLGLRGRRLTVIDDQLNLGAHGRGEGQTTGLALAHIESRLGEVVLDELHLHKTVVGDDGEGRVEGRLQAFDGAFFGGYICLQECGICIFLHLQQVRHFEHAVAAPEAFADSLAFGVRIGHEISGQRHESWVCDDCPTWKAPCGLGGWPLPTMADGDALHIARTKASSAVGLSEDTRKQAAPDRFLVCSMDTLSTSAKGWRPFFGASSP